MATETKETFRWPPLESNPEVFTDYMRGVGLTAEWAINELYGFDEDLLGMLPQPVMAVIANVERLAKADDRQRGDAALVKPGLFYMKQHDALDNACGVIACLHAVYNTAAGATLPAESILARHLATASALDPAARAAALEANVEFQSVHKAMASEGQSAMAQSQSDVRHHFVAFVLIDGNLVELDGTKAGPLIVTEGCTDCLRGAVAAVQQRLAAGEYSDRLSMMALCPAMN